VSPPALDAYAHYGSGRHLAPLNQGNCFAHTCAKSKKARLLFMGNDFIKIAIGRLA
jgi:ribonuclease VapC